MLFETFRPSIRVSLTNLWDETRGALFLMSLVVLLRALEAWGLATLGDISGLAVALYDDAVMTAVALAVDLGVAVPRAAVDAMVVYSFSASVVAQTEQSDLLAVVTDPATRARSRASAWTSLRRGRTDLVLCALPDRLRAVVVRALWPLVLPYRFKIPFQIEGPGPRGEFVASSVSLAAMPGFRAMLEDRGTWSTSEVVDVRMVLAGNLLLAFGVSYLTSHI